jgi:hypothetical protein
MASFDPEEEPGHDSQGTKQFSSMIQKIIDFY